MTTDDNGIMPKFCFKYFCENCDYGTSKSSSYKSHMTSAKHYKTTQNNDNYSKFCQQHICQNCNKLYNDRAGLWRHKKKCLIQDEKNNESLNEKNKEGDVKVLTNLVLEVVKNNNETQKQNQELQNLLIEQNKQNQELQNQVLEICKNGINNNGINNIINNTNNNSNNKTFNMQFFLNETCKNAMNITDFVDSIKLQISDLESVGKIGYVEGLSKIIIKNLNALDVTERPVHCSDTKRDTLYVKDDDKWEKEEEDNHIILKAIEDIANKNTKQIKEWKRLNPECASSKSHKADVYSHILIEALCSNNDINNYKVLKKIAKEVAINKS